MKDTFDSNLAWVLLQEGGFARLKGDEVTNLGVKKSTWESWVDRPVTDKEIEALTVAKVKPLYLKNYYQANRCEDLFYPLDLCAFDFGVNSGVGRSLGFLSHICLVSLEEKSKPLFLETLNNWPDKAKLINLLCDQRLSFLKNLKLYYLYGKGWNARVGRLRAHCLDALLHPQNMPAK